MSTVKEYYNNAYTKELETTVISCQKCELGYDIVLESTCFFPEAGGQSADRGIISAKQSSGEFLTSNVIDVQIDSSDLIHHYCDKPIVVGETVTITIDWIRRHTFMQHHTAEHIFSGLVNKTFGYDNVGFHLSDNICTMDYNGKLSDKDVAELENRTNECIFSNCAVEASFPSDEELEETDYRCKGELTPPIRIVKIDKGNIDTCACCAPHVRYTGEIGSFKVVSAVSYKGGTRLTIICGRSAFSLFKEYSAIISDTSHILSVPDGEITTRIKDFMDERYNLKQEIISLHNKKLESRICDIPKAVSDVLLFESDIETKTIRNCVNRLIAEHDGLCGIFCGSDSDGYNFILASSKKDMKETTDLMRHTLGAKCGGSPKMIQGFVKSSESEILKTLNV